MNNLFNSEKGGIETLYGWMGQIVDDACWVYNHANSDFKHKIHTSKDVAGYGYRYKVRIFGRDVETKDIPDDQLEMAEVLLPVTAGSGHGGSVQTPNIRQGMYVWGFYKDGMDATEPIIVGVLPNNSQTSLFGGNPDKNFVPRSGYFGQERTLPIATKNIKLEGPSSLSTNEGTNVSSATVAQQDQQIDGKRKFYIPKTINCEGSSGEVDGIQKTIRQLLIDLQKVKKFTQSFAGAASNLASNISNLISDATSLISSIVKSLMMKIRSFIVNALNEKISSLIDLLPPNQRPNSIESTKNVTDTIQCIFNKIITKLSTLIEKLLRDIVEKYINAPLCAAESFVGNFLSSILGDLTSGITEALSSISGLVFDASNIIFLGIDVITGVLKSISCEEDLDCQILDEWSFWDGANIKLDNIIEEKTSSKIKKFVDQTAPVCNYSQIPCGPPKLQLYGGGINEASGNLVVSSTGYILGVDLFNGGQYTSEPNVQIIDDCGSGDGAILYPILEETSINNSNNQNITTITPTEITYTITDFVVIDSGFGYLNYPDGSTGGDGVKLSGPCDTIVNVDVYSPNSNVGVKTGDLVYLPNNSTTDIFNAQNEIVQTLNGNGQLSPIIIEQSGQFTTPDCPTGIGTTSSPGIGTTSIGISTNILEGSVSIGTTYSYSVVASIKDLAVLNGGVDYLSTDIIEITPNNGADIRPIFDDFGKLVDVNVVSGGIGFIDKPEIKIKSETGYNAVLVPIFKFERIKTQEELLNISRGVPVINVIDCVGKV